MTETWISKRKINFFTMRIAYKKDIGEGGGEFGLEYVYIDYEQKVTQIDKITIFYQYKITVK